MSVRLLPNGKYQIDIYITQTERFRKNVAAQSKLQAILIEKEYRKQLNKAIGDVYSINSIAPQYLEYVKNHQSPRTYKDKFRMLNAEILPFFGNFMPDYITPIMIEDFKKKRLKKHAGIHREINLKYFA